MSHGQVNETAKRRRMRLLGDALASGGLSLIFPRRQPEPDPLLAKYRDEILLADTLAGDPGLWAEYPAARRLGVALSAITRPMRDGPIGPEGTRASGDTPHHN